MSTLNNKEEWKDIKDYEGIYQVSNLGRVKSLKFDKEKILNTGKASSGYLMVCFSKNGKKKARTVHSVVAEAFLDHEPNGYKLVVNHINFDRLDNRVENLEVVTNRENSNQKHLKSTSNYTGVSWYNRTKKWESKIRVNGKSKHLGLFTNELEASRAYQNKLKEINNKLK